MSSGVTHTYPGDPEQQLPHCEHSNRRPCAYHTDWSITGGVDDIGKGTQRDVWLKGHLGENRSVPDAA